MVFVNQVYRDKFGWYNQVLLVIILKYYERGIQKVLSYEDYIDRLSQCIKYLKSDIAIFRLFSDFEPGTIAPVWDINKTLLIKKFEKNLEQLNINQGMI